MWQGQKLLLFIQIQVAVPLCSAALTHHSEHQPWCCVYTRRCQKGRAPRWRSRAFSISPRCDTLLAAQELCRTMRCLATTENVSSLTFSFFFFVLKRLPSFFLSCVFISQINFLLWLSAKVSCMFFIRSENSLETPWHTVSSHWWWHTFGLLSLPVSYHN